MSSRKPGWEQRVRQIEQELVERGPSETDDRKVRFLIAAYLRDIRDQLAGDRTGISAPTPRSAWDVEDAAARDDNGDTRPFAFDQLRVPDKDQDDQFGKRKHKDDDKKR